MKKSQIQFSKISELSFRILTLRSVYWVLFHVLRFFVCLTPSWTLTLQKSNLEPLFKFLMIAMLGLFLYFKSPSMLDEKYYKKGVCFLIFWDLYIFNCIWEKCIQNFCKKNKRKITVVLNGIICFSVRFCDSLLFMLKIRFEVFSFANRKVQGFSSDRKILMSLLSVLFYLQNLLSAFWSFNF